jgi:hypothetical protein
MPIKLGNKIKLTKKEKDLISMVAGEEVNPETVEDHNAWLESSKFQEDSPEARLLNATFDVMKIK